MANRDLQGEASRVSDCAPRLTESSAGLTEFSARLTESSARLTESSARLTESSAGTQIVSLRGLSDKELLDGLAALVRRDHALTVDILLHLGEVEVRGLHHASGCSSLFTYCVERLGFPEEVAYKRVGASRLVRQFPFALELLAQGQLHLTALMLVRSHLTAQNHREWLVAACHKTKREVELLVATRCPRADVPSSIRRLPERSGGVRLDEAGADGRTAASAVFPVEAVVHGQAATAVDNAVELGAVGQVAAAADGGDEASVAPRKSLASTIPGNRSLGSTIQKSEIRCKATSSKLAVPRVEPLSSSSYRVVFTASHRLKQKLDRAAELISHSVVPGDLPALIERAVDQLIEREAKRRFAANGQRTNSERPIAAARDNGSGRQDPDSARARRTKECRGEPAQQDPDLVAPVRAEEMQIVRARSEPVEGTDRVRSEPVEGMDRVRSEPVEGMDRVRSEQRTRRRRRFCWPVATTSRYVAAEVRRRIWERDGGQCAFVDTEGNRCQERRFLQIEHRNPHARGGASTIDNCCLLCAWHNRYRAKQEFGEALMQKARSRP